MNKTLKKVLKTILIILLVLVAAVILFIGYLTITEYKPKDTEPLDIDGSSSETLAAGDDFTIMTWNMGYAGLGENADFFMDGGEHVRSCTESQVNNNIDAVVAQIQKEDADVVFLQEVDRDSKRSYGIDELEKITSSLDGYNSTFARNYKVAYVPYPLVSEDMWTPGVIDVDEFGDNLTFVTDNSTPSCRSLDRPLAGNDSDPSVFQYYMIDGFIVSDNLTINTVETRDLGFKNSDHNPIVMNVTVTK